MVMYLGVVIYALLCVANAGTTVDFLKEKNQDAHHTSSYRLGKEDLLPLRRCNTFAISYELPPSDIKVEYVLQTDKGDSIVIPYVSQPVTDTWAAWTSGSVQTINIPANAAVGLFTFSVQWLNTTSNEKKSFPQATQVAVLFNPYSASDDVYMSDPKMLHEFVSNEEGAMWLSRTSSPIGWTFDQHSVDVLLVTLELLEEVDFSDRGNPVVVSRALSALMNANDEGGLLAGKWQEPYDGGKYPWSWTGSGEIFSSYRQTRRYVRWGQCWVFAGVLVSASRTIGIPSRQITNFESAHEEQQPYRLTIDFFSDENGNPVKSLGSIWNFHAWTEVWFKRPDLGGTGGWQIVDATPQELSSGIFQLGPSSQLDVRNRKLDDEYDTTFVVSEVAAAVRQYVHFNTGKPEHPFVKGYYLSDESLDATGKMISTKAVGGISRNDVTAEYKKASRAESNVLFHTVVSDEVNFTLVSSDTLVIGEDLHMKLVLRCAICTPSNNRTIQVSDTLELYSYDGIPIQKLKSDLDWATLANDKPSTILFSLTAAEYQGLLVDGSFIQSNIFAKVYKGEHEFTGQYFSQVKRFEIVAPSLTLSASNFTGSTITIHVQFTNPLSVPLTNAYLTLSGAHIDNVGIDVGTVETTLQVEPVQINIISWSQKNTCTIFAKLWTDQVSFFEGQFLVYRQ